jgi:hypothetical protein
MCCPNVEQNDQLLRLILKKIGSEDLPATVPTLLTNRDKGTTQVHNLAQFTSYAVKQMDALCGKYPIQIDVEDVDLVQEGEQKKSIKLPNIAETLAEIMGLCLTIRSESDATLQATIRNLIETGSTKQIALLAHDYSKANSEFLGYKGEQIERIVPFAFKPGEERLDKILQEGEVKVKGFENNDPSDLNDQLLPLLELAAQWKAQNFRTLGAKSPGEVLTTILENANNFTTVLDEAIKAVQNQPTPSNPDEPPQPSEKNDFDAFVTETEWGFISQPGITENTKPYGRDMKQRPKIREIGVDTSDSDD